MALTVLIGGARSGKSSLAVEIGRRHGGPVTYIATATPLDEDMTERIDRHRAERPAGWTTIEEPIDLVGAMTRADESLVIIDCLTLWTSHLMLHGHSDDDIDVRAIEAAHAAATRRATVVAVSNEVGLGIHPDTDLGRRFRDVLGRVNQSWVGAASRSLLLVAGRAVELSDPWPFLDDDHEVCPR